MVFLPVMSFLSERTFLQTVFFFAFWGRLYPRTREDATAGMNGGDQLSRSLLRAGA
jgi:hypothetical protein